MSTLSESAQHVLCFTNPSCSGSLARIENLLEQLAFEHRAGLREESVISVHSIELAQEGDDAVWREIGRELEDVGITQPMIWDHKDFIIDWIKGALQSVRFDEASPGSSSSAGSDWDLSGSYICVGDQTDASDIAIEYGIETADSIEKRWTFNASLNDYGNLIEIQQTDSVQVHIEQ